MNETSLVVGFCAILGMVLSLMCRLHNKQLNIKEFFIKYPEMKKQGLLFFIVIVLAMIYLNY